ncbi:MAG TPA: hypothetical protein VKJ65_06475 [Phycisphaerae bacterium]|nr:hypothetical protein [Phycisphaerae bacterium]
MPEDPTTLAQTQEGNAPAVVHENLEGYKPQLDNEAAVCEAVEKAFSYRGDITIITRTGQTFDGYIFDRKTVAGLANSFLRLIPKDGGPRIRISYAEIAQMDFSGRDAAAGKSFQTWLKKYNEKKAAGEKNIRIDPEPI